MRFSSAILLATAASVAADISVESKAGKRLLSKARKLNYDVSQNWGYGYGYYKDGNYNNRQYDENYNNGMYEENYNNGMYQQNYNNGQYNQNYNNGQYNQQNNGNQQQQEQAEQGEYNEEDYDYQQYYEDQQQANANRTTEGTNGTNPNWGMDVDTNYDLSWMPGYSIKFDGCSTEYFKDAEENTMRLLAKFKLCPSTSTCSKCKGAGEYIIPMEEFVAAYENVLMSEDACAQTRGQCQQECQQAEQNYQQNDDQENEAEEDEDDDANVYDEETCWSSCMANYGMSSCESLSDKVNCRQMDYYNKDEDPYYVGATCKNGGVYLETFTDMYCTRPAAEGTYEALTGSTLPEANLVSSDCIECKASGGQNNNQYQQNDAAEQGQYAVCEELYSEAGKCEANMKDLPYKNNGACDYMHGTLARMNRDAKGYFVSVLKYAAWFLVAGALIFLGYKCYIRRRIINQASSRDALIPEKDLDEPLAGDSNKATEVPAADADGQAAYQGGEIPSEEAPKENLTPATVV